MRKIIALALAIVLCVGILPLGAAATDESDAEKIIRFQDVEAYHGSFPTIYLKSGETATLPGVPTDGPYITITMTIRSLAGAPSAVQKRPSITRAIQ